HLGRVARAPSLTARRPRAEDAPGRRHPMHASSGLLALTLLLAAVPRAAADCGDDTADAGAVASARAQADARCDCATAPNHDRYVACVVGTAKDLVRRGLLPRQCRNTVARCRARPPCGTPRAPAPPSCCGAGAGGCGTSPTTTTLPSSTCTSDGQCDDGNGC